MEAKNTYSIETASIIPKNLNAEQYQQFFHSQLYQKVGKDVLLENSQANSSK